METPAPTGWDQFITDIISVYWWVSVVIVGLLINIASSYMKPGLDILGARISTKWRETLRRRKAEHDAIVNHLIQDQSLLTVMGIEELRWRLRYLVLLVCSLILLAFGQSLETKTMQILLIEIVRHPIMASTIAYIASLLCFVAVLASYNSAARIARILLDVKARKSSLDSDLDHGPVDHRQI